MPLMEYMNSFKSDFQQVFSFVYELIVGDYIYRVLPNSFGIGKLGMLELTVNLI